MLPSDQRCSIIAPRRSVIRCWPIITGLILLFLLNRLVASPQPPANGPYQSQLEPFTAVSFVPAFELPAINGVRHRLSQYRGQIVVVNFWSTWCSPCRREMPSLQRAWMRLKLAGMVVLGVAIQDDLDMVKRFVREGQITFPILIDADGLVAARWPFSGIPATFVLDRKGRIIYHAMGMREWDSDELIHQLLAMTEQH